MDYYKVLGVEKDATNEEIKKAYRELSKASHPDINKAKKADHLFMLIKEAYETLIDPVKRYTYDEDMGYSFTAHTNKTDTRHTNHGFADEKHDEGFDYRENATANTYDNNFSNPHEVANNKFQKKHWLIWIAGISGVITAIIAVIDTGKITDMFLGLLIGVGNVFLLYYFYLIIRHGGEN